MTRSLPPPVALGRGVTLLGVVRVLGRQGVPVHATVSSDDLVAGARVGCTGKRVFPPLTPPSLLLNTSDDCRYRAPTLLEVRLRDSGAIRASQGLGLARRAARRALGASVLSRLEEIRRRLGRG